MWMMPLHVNQKSDYDDDECDTVPEGVSFLFRPEGRGVLLSFVYVCRSP